MRELRNVIERSVSLGLVAEAPRPPRAPSGLPPASVESVVALHLPLKEARQAWTESFESVYVRTLLRQLGGNVTHAAERAGVSRRFLQRLIARLGIKAGDVGIDAGDLAGDD